MAENKLCHYGDKCNRGSKCTFIHPKEGDSPLFNLKSNKKCKDGNNCKYLPNCRYDHSSSTMGQSATTSPKLILVIE